MKKLIFICFAFFTISGSAQLEAENIKYAWQRTSYEHWDHFDPWILFFNILGIKGPFYDYKQKDRRTMSARSGTLTLWAAYADQYEMHNRTTDSIYKQEVYKALDRTLNKNYIVLQQTRVETLYNSIETNVLAAQDNELPPALIGLVEGQYLRLVENIEFLKNSYVPDADKYPIIEEEIKKLEQLMSISFKLPKLAILFEEDFIETQLYDFSIPINDNTVLIESLINE